MTRAMEDHRLAVGDALSKFAEQVFYTAPKLAQNKAQQYLNYGIGRRLRMMLVSFAGVVNTNRAGRKEPLLRDEMATVSRDLNIIYVNIGGILDNYAWCIFHEHGF